MGTVEPLEAISVGCAEQGGGGDHSGHLGESWLGRWWVGGPAIQANYQQACQLQGVMNSWDVAS